MFEVVDVLVKLKLYFKNHFASLLKYAVFFPILCDHSLVTRVDHYKVVVRPHLSPVSQVSTTWVGPFVLKFVFIINQLWRF